MTDYSKYEQLIYKTQPEKSGFIGKRKTHSDEELKQINEYVRKGYSVRNISVETGIPKSVVGRYVKKLQHDKLYDDVLRNLESRYHELTPDNIMKQLYEKNKEDYEREHTNPHPLKKHFYTTEPELYGRWMIADNEKIYKELNVSKEIVDKYIKEIQDDIINLRIHVSKIRNCLDDKQINKFSENRKNKIQQFWDLCDKNYNDDEIKKIMNCNEELIYECFASRQSQKLYEESKRQEEIAKSEYRTKIEMETIEKYGPSQEQKLAEKTLLIIEKNLDSAPEETRLFITSCIQMAKVKAHVGY